METCPVPGYVPSARLALFPISARLEEGKGNERLTIDGHDLAALADEHGTPLYLYDQATLDGAVTAYRTALNAAYPGPSGVTYAAKAFLCLAVAQWAQARGLWLDCSGAGEITTARAAGVSRGMIVVHGINKSPVDLAAAIEEAGTIVVDHLGELDRIAVLMAGGEACPCLWLRLRPGVAVETHAYTQTGQSTSKFGMDASEVQKAVAFCLARRLNLIGLHFHLGSHFHRPDEANPAVDAALDLIASLDKEYGWQPEILCPGGGWGVPYHEDDLPHAPIEEYTARVAAHVAAGCRQRRLRLPHLQMEPGRSLVARAGVALYRVGGTKQAGERRWVLLDGGLVDNVRPALYGARYSALPVLEPSRPSAGPAWLAGPYCESSDVLASALPLPDLSPGELLAVPVSGAYQLSMASNYNGARRPAVLWLASGSAHVVRRREKVTDLYRLDGALPANCLLA
jgi:diaminopimelate decarboxylase